jgi:murein DD-endopeptidase MepM/ murein hydrolase activator NlpD
MGKRWLFLAQKRSGVSMLGWGALVICLALGAYLVGTQLAHSLVSSTSPTPSAKPVAVGAQVRRVTPGNSVEGHLGPERADVWMFDAQTGQIATLQIWVDPRDSSNPGAKFGLDLKGPGGTWLFHQSGTASLPPHMTLELPEDGTYQMELIPLSGILGQYSMRLTLEERETGEGSSEEASRVTPTVEIRVYTVKEGDTLWGIARDFHVAPEAILDANESIASPDMIHPGLELTIPLVTTDSERSDTCLQTSDRKEVITYVVQSGDTLSGLACKFGVSIATIRWANIDKLSDDPDELDFREVLTIPPMEGVLHTVAPGDTLESLAGRYQVDASTIVGWAPNDLAGGQDLEVGREIMIPNGFPLQTLADAAAEEETMPPPTMPPDTSPDETPEPTTPPAPGGFTYVDPFNKVSRYDTGYCGSVSAGQGWSSSLAWPTASRNLDPNRGFSGSHPAIDILTSMGDSVFAAETGVVIWAGFNSWGYGNLIILDHGGGRQTYYAHLEDVSVACGQTVTQGAVIGTVGMSGASVNPHLHFEFRHSNYNYNPLRWLP